MMWMCGDANGRMDVNKRSEQPMFSETLSERMVKERSWNCLQENCPNYLRELLKIFRRKLTLRKWKFFLSEDCRKSLIDYIYCGPKKSLIGLSKFSQRIDFLSLQKLFQRVVKSLSEVFNCSQRRIIKKFWVKIL